MNGHLLRHLAPISDAGWSAIEEDVKPRLEVQLAARKLVDFTGPAGWEHSATNLGRSQSIDGPAADITAVQRLVLPVVEMRADFVLSRRELDDVERGARDVDLAPLEEAAHRFAVAENRAVFHGFPAAGITGIVDASSHEPIPLEDDPNRYPAAVARAVDVLRNSGVGGPYGIAIAPDIYTEIAETAEHGGYPLFDHLREILGGPVVWAPGIECGLVLSQRGGDFVFDSGEDIAIGYRSHDADEVNLYLEESYTFRVLEPDAAVKLQSPST
jgi:uncharacterized linocin/CFP29 family protein